MSEFKDSKNRTWRLDPVVGTIKRIRDEIGVNVLDLGDSKSTLMVRLYQEPWLLCDILFAACKPQMDAAKVTSQEFGECLGGDLLGAALDALQNMLVSFSSGGRRDLLQKIFDKSHEVEAMTHQMAIDRLDNPDLISRIRTQAGERLDQMLDQANLPPMNGSMTTTDFRPESESTGTAGSLADISV